MIEECTPTSYCLCSPTKKHLACGLPCFMFHIGVRGYLIPEGTGLQAAQWARMPSPSTKAKTMLGLFNPFVTSAYPPAVLA